MEGTLLSLLADRAESNRALYTFLDRKGEVASTLSYRELFTQACAVAAVLQMHGCFRQPVLVYCPHGREYIIAFYGVILAGAWPVPCTRRRGQPSGHLSRMLATTGALTVVTTPARIALEPTVIARKDITIVFAGGDCLDVPVWRRPPLRAEDIAFIQYTSGSTSQPRGVRISHANVLHNSAMIQRAFGCGPADTGLCWLPLHHDMGLIGHVVQPLYSRIHNYFMSPVEFAAQPMRWLLALSRYQATISGGPDFAFSHCVASSSGEPTDLNLSTWRIAYCGAERVRVSTMRAFEKKFSASGFDSRAFFPCYGLAESTLFVCGRQGLKLAGQGEQPEVSLGCPQPDTTIAIVDNESGQRVAEGERGEVWLKSSAIAAAYNDSPAATASTFNNELDGRDGYLRTGDIGRLVDGELYLGGRIKNVLKRHGRSIYAEDMEDALTRALASHNVARVVASAVNMDDDEKCAVLLERAPAQRAVITPPVGELVLLTKQVLADRVGVTVDYVFVLAPRSVPLTSSGKIRRQACYSICQQLAANHETINQGV